MQIGHERNLFQTHSLITPTLLSVHQGYHRFAISISFALEASAALRPLESRTIRQPDIVLAMQTTQAHWL